MSSYLPSGRDSPDRERERDRDRDRDRRRQTDSLPAGRGRGASSGLLRQHAVQHGYQYLRPDGKHSAAAAKGAHHGAGIKRKKRAGQGHKKAYPLLELPSLPMDLGAPA